MEKALLSLLLADAGVTALVPAANIDWQRRPQGTAYPAVILRVINDRPAYLLSDTTDRASARVQIDCWALTYPAAKAVSRAVRACLSGHRDATFQRVWLLGARDTQDPEAQGDPSGVSMDFEIDYRAT